MKIFIFNREKFIKEGLDWYNKCVEIDKYCNVKTRPREEVVKELEDAEWAKELDGVIIDNWINPFGNHLKYYTQDINEEWCDVAEDENYTLDYRKVTNIYVLHELLKEKSNNKEMFKTKELIDTLNKFGEVERSKGSSSLALYFKDGKSRDNIWINGVDKYNCYITAYGCWDGRAGGMLFDNRDEYDKDIGWLKLTDEMIKDIENGNFRMEFEIKDPYMFEVGKEEDNE